MPLLIDCYNVLCTTMPASLAGLDEARLCQLLLRAPWSRGGVTVVCDGVPKPTSPHPDAVLPIQLLYAGSGRSADDLIIDSISTDSAPRSLRVVSNDRQIKKAARRRRCRVMSCERFIEHLAKIAAQPTSNTGLGSSTPPDIPGFKHHGLAKQQTRDWLRCFGFDEEEDVKPSEPDDFDDENWWKYGSQDPLP